MQPKAPTTHVGWVVGATAGEVAGMGATVAPEEGRSMERQANSAQALARCAAAHTLPHVPLNSTSSRPEEEAEGEEGEEEGAEEGDEVGVMGCPVAGSTMRTGRLKTGGGGGAGAGGEGDGGGGGEDRGPSVHTTPAGS